MEMASAVLADTWGMHGDVGTGWWIVMMFWMALFWGAIILGIVWLARGSLGGRREERRETPLEILDRRFAEGAIPVDEYHERREVITTGARRPPRAGGEEGATVGPSGETEP